MKIKLKPEEIWREYRQALDFNGQSSLDLEETVRRNENFYIGRQWVGLEAPDLDKPVMNILKRVVTFFISSIVSDDIAVNVASFQEEPGSKEMMDMLGLQFSEIMERSGFKRKCRDALRNAAVDGDGCLHYYFDPEDGYTGGIDTAEGLMEGDGLESLPTETPGSIQAELLDNTDVFFGNPQRGEVEKQPYLIIRYRRFLEEVKETAADNGNRAEDIEADSEDNTTVEDSAAEHRAGSEMVTVLRKYYRKKGEIWVTEVTRTAVVRKSARLGYRRYPLVWMPWEKVKNQYHGQAALTGMIDNQVFINKMFAMVMEHLKRMAFPKVVYNKAMFPGGWTNRVGAAIGVNGDPNAALGRVIQPADMSAQVILSIEKVIQYTKETMGASDAALGTIKPDNTSAIIATQKATAMPLELQKMEFYQMVEDSVRIWLEMMAENYGIRRVEMKTPAPLATPSPLSPAGMGLPGQGVGPGLQEMVQALGGLPEGIAAGAGGFGGAPAGRDEVPETTRAPFDFGGLKGINLRLNVDIGASTYWSELMQVQTLDNLFSRGIITDPEQYIEMVPAAYLPGKGQLLEHIRKEKAKMEAMAAMAPAAGADGGGGGGMAMPPELAAMMGGNAND